jgi:hypothetical protein
MEEDRHLAWATIGRRLSTVVGFYRFAVVDGYMAESPAQYVRRPKIDTESTTLGLDRMELGAFLPQAAPVGWWTTTSPPRPPLPARPVRAPTPEAHAAYATAALPPCRQFRPPRGHCRPPN